MRGLLIIAALGSGGCNLVFGLEEPGDGDGPADGGPDGPRGFGEPVTLQIAGGLELAVLKPVGERVGEAVALAIVDSSIVRISADAGRDVTVGFLPLEVPPVSLAGLDANADGVSDVVVVTGEGFDVYAGTTDDELARVNQVTVAGGTVIAAGPYVDPDGDDLVLAHSAASGALTEWQGNGAGIYTPGIAFPVDGEIRAIESLDFEGDGVDEIVVAGSVEVQAYQRAPMVFTEYGPALWGPSTAILAIRLDDNDTFDVLIGDATGELTPIVSDGGGGFQRRDVVGTAAVGAMALARGDADGDGRDDDVAVAAPGANLVTVYVSPGDGSLVEAQRLPVPAAPSLVTFADLDGDRLDDLVVVLASEVMIFFGQ